VHLNGLAHGALPWERPVVAVGHSCVLSWWDAVRRQPTPPEWRRYLDAARTGLAGADAVVAPTRSMLASLKRHYGVRGGVVIHNGSAAPPCDHGAREPFLLAAGRLWDEAKNLAALDAAAVGLPWPVVAAGEGPAGATVRSIGRVPRQELRALMERASVFVAPARYEPFGLAPLEAARAGCALLLGEIESLREVWGNAALYADPDDPAALRSAIVRLMEDAKLRGEMARRAQERSSRYSLTRMARAYAALYSRLAARAGVAA
jgi:glycosyltransferase involved in cell wall biosynthesis